MLIPPNGFRIPSAKQLSRPFSVAAAGLPGGFSLAAGRCYLSLAGLGSTLIPSSRFLLGPVRDRADWRLITASIEGLFVRSVLNPLIP